MKTLTTKDAMQKTNRWLDILLSIPDNPVSRQGLTMLCFGGFTPVFDENWRES